MRWKPKHARPYWHGKSAAWTAVGGVTLVAVVGVGWWAMRMNHDGDAVHASGAVTIEATDSAGGPAGPSAAATAAERPVSVDIPAINVHTTLQQLGLDPSGALEPPTNQTQAGWYTGSAVPGSAGPAVIAGHVDSFRGPAVFFGLRLLKPGDSVTVGLSSGRHVTFRVMVVKSYPKDAFPTADVYGARPDPELRLITCGGGFTAGHYLDNLVVYAALRS